jgi:hypothetical protein
MRSRTRMIAAAAAVAAGSGAALASTTGGKPGTTARTPSASGRPNGAGERQAHDAMTAAVAQALHVSTARVSAALRPLFAAGADDYLAKPFALEELRARLRARSRSFAGP